MVTGIPAGGEPGAPCVPPVPPAAELPEGAGAPGGEEEDRRGGDDQGTESGEEGRLGWLKCW